MTPDERERRAKALMNDPLFVESFEALRKELLSSIKLIFAFNISDDTGHIDVCINLEVISFIFMFLFVPYILNLKELSNKGLKYKYPIM